jgi:hypothetical protein
LGQRKTDKRGLKLEVEVGNLIIYNYLFSNEENKFGIVVKIEEDLNFGFMLHILCKSIIEKVPYTIVEYRKI